MPKIKYQDLRLSSATKEIIEKGNQLLRKYAAQGFTELTLRFLYYKYIGFGLFPDSWIDEDYNRRHGLQPGTKNTVKNYKRLGKIIDKGRMAGLVDWEGFTDPTRYLRGLEHVSGPSEMLEDAVAGLHLDKWRDQEHHVEVWLEKDALIGVIRGLCRRLDVDYFSTRGYNSQSAMWRAAQRMRWYTNGKNKKCVVLDLRDHDPSGVDMTRDVDDRFRLFLGDVQIERVALNLDQIRLYDPPPNPAKVTDSRAAAYVERFGHDSWELDALEPQVMNDLIEQAVLGYRDDDLWEAACQRQKHDRERLRKVSRNWSGLDRHWSAVRGLLTDLE